ncbi:Kynureninase [Sulfobacillus acidophilus DSM 10332]|uniref:Kynureninase n=1 Tax=Sulfobacillus acidophilus (strain ATCC 700253 / DSM 10332 / NAL) TaxID=679936 RepID=G8TVL4_SULAD|nr:Kynureninase [Sulfobacillus acidophilus DSM 10332]
MSFTLSRQFAETEDRNDPLAPYRRLFPPAAERIYLAGNSLGLWSERAEQSLMAVLESWRHHGVDGWSHGPYPWFDLSERLGRLMVPLVGANPHEVIVTGSTTVNLHQLLATFYRPRGRRIKILTDSLAFPSDIYAIKSHITLHGLTVEEALIEVASPDGLTLDENAVIQAMTDDVALVILPSVLFVSGQRLDMATLTAAAHDRGILIGFDLAHSVGIMPHQLSAWGVDFAFWCTYKYLNGGPGSVGALYVADRHLPKTPGLAGWFSSDKAVQFDMAHTLVPSSDAGAFQIGTPHILSLAPLMGSLEMFREIPIETIRDKSLRLTRYLMDLVNHRLADRGFRIVTPLQDARRGGHVALAHPDAIRISKALKARQVIPDYRPPRIIRLAPSPLYTTYQDVWDTVNHLWEIMEYREYERYSPEREVVS